MTTEATGFFAALLGCNIDLCVYLVLSVFVFAVGNFAGGIDNPILWLLVPRGDHSGIPYSNVQWTTVLRKGTESKLGRR